MKASVVPRSLPLATLRGLATKPQVRLHVANKNSTDEGKILLDKSISDQLRRESPVLKMDSDVVYY